RPQRSRRQGRALRAAPPPGRRWRNRWPASPPRRRRPRRSVGGADMARALVVGAGLAGCEAAWQLAERGHDVTLVEMRPVRGTPAHRTDRFAGPVCTQWFKSEDPPRARGLLKWNLRAPGSILLRAAQEGRMPAGAALAVDRDAFSARMTELVTSHPRITIERR